MSRARTAERPRSLVKVGLLPVVIALLLMVGGGAAPSPFLPTAQAAGGSTLYVDGKTGNDTNTGLEPARALKTIARAAALLPAGSTAAGWTVSVQGYVDYVYRERPIPPGWNRRGTATAPITFQATGYVTGSTASYIKPVVSGSDLAPAAGQIWSTTSSPGVWRTPWTQAPFGFGGSQIALFQNNTTWLWQQSSLAALADRAKLGQGGFWYDSGAQSLYVSALGSANSGANDPSRYKIDVVMRNAFLFMGTQGVAYVAVRGFSVQHSANGIAFLKGADYGTIVDNVVNANLMMGIATSGGQTSNGPDPSTGNIVVRNTGSYNTIQMIKVDEGTQDSVFCDNSASRNALQGIKVQGPPGDTTYEGSTSGINICRNTLANNNYNPTGSVFNNASGLTIANGAQRVTVESNKIYSNDVGIHVTQERPGRAPLNQILLKSNSVHDNRRFGLNLYDGAPGPDSGTGVLLSEYDLYWKNGIGVMAARGTANKTISHSTVFDNVNDGIKVGDANQAASSLVVTGSIVTKNGGFGLWLVTGSNAALSHVNFSSNVLGASKGSPSTEAINTYPAGFVTTDPTAKSFLQVSTNSYQYTAGPSATPLGAR